jgi:hypothetical protein
MKLKYWGLCLFVFCGAISLHSQGFAQPALGAFSDNTQISLLTCSPGEDLYSTFGHSGIRLTDRASYRDVVFNYGIFDFHTPNFYLKFMRGKLLYQMGLQSFSDFMYEYQYLGRSVTETKLSLPLAAKRKLLLFLENNYRPENREYLYDFFFDNCATRIRDVVEKSLPIVYPPQDTVRKIKHLRQLLDEYLGTMPWSDFGIDLVLGQPTDQLGTFRNEMFLPDYLAKNLSKAQYQGKPIALPTQTLLKGLPPSPFRSKFPKPWLFFSLLAALFLALTFLATKKIKKGADAFFFSTLGLAGCILLFMWLGTDHIATKNNWNLLWANPLYLFTLGSLGGKRKYWWLVLGGSTIVVLLFFPWWPQQFHPAIIPILLTTVQRSVDRWLRG